MSNGGLISGAFSSTSGKADVVLTTNGDILYYNNGRQRLPKEDNDDILTLKSGLPSWEAPSAGGNQFLIIGAIDNFNNYGDIMFPLGIGSGQSSGTDAYVSLTLYLAFTIQRHTLKANVNSMDGNTIQSFRDDGSSVASVTLTASTTGEYDSGEISVSISDESVCNLLLDTSASGSGNIEEVAWNFVCS